MLGFLRVRGGSRVNRHNVLVARNECERDFDEADYNYICVQITPFIDLIRKQPDPYLATLPKSSRVLEQMVLLHGSDVEITLAGSSL